MVSTAECRPEFESKKAWRRFLEMAAEQEADDALGEVLRLTRLSEQYGKAARRRLRTFFDDGAAIYAKRFGRDWLPF